MAGLERSELASCSGGQIAGVCLGQRSSTLNKHENKYKQQHNPAVLSVINQAVRSRTVCGVRFSVTSYLMSFLQKKQH